MIYSRDISLLRADVAANCRKFIEIAAENGYPVCIVNTVRDNEKQQELYEIGTGGKPPATFHHVDVGLAFDICKNSKTDSYTDAGFWAFCGALGQKMGFEWGGSWKSFVDKPHFQWSQNGKYTSAMIRARKLPPDMPLYEEDEDMTQDTFNALYNGVNPTYATLDDVPEYWREETQALIEAGKIRGDETGALNIRHETLRAIIAGAR